MFIPCYPTQSVACSFVIGVWVYSLVSSPFPDICVCMCVCVFRQKNKIKRYPVLSSHPKSVRCDIKKEFITCFATLTTARSFGVVVWVYSLVSSPFPNTNLCKCVFIKKDKKEKKKRYSVLSSRPISVMCDIEKGFITCSLTLIAAGSIGVGMRVHFLVSSTFPEIFCVCVCVWVIDK